jgi:hypothetical protein
MGKLPTIRPVPAPPTAQPLHPKALDFAPARVRGFYLAQPRLVLTAVTATVTFQNLIPGKFLWRLRYIGQTDNAGPVNVLMRINNISTASYFSNTSDDSNVNADTESLGATSGLAGSVAQAVNLGEGTIEIFPAAQAAFGGRVLWQYQSWRIDGGAAGNTHTQIGGGTVASGDVGRIDLFLSAGNWKIGSTFSLAYED